MRTRRCSFSTNKTGNSLVKYSVGKPGRSEARKPANRHMKLLLTTRPQMVLFRGKHNTLWTFWRQRDFVVCNDCVDGITEEHPWIWLDTAMPRVSCTKWDVKGVTTRLCHGRENTTEVSWLQSFKSWQVELGVGFFRPGDLQFWERSLST